MISVAAPNLIGIVRFHVVDAKDLPKAESWFGGGISDPCVKISNPESGWEYAETKTIYNTTTPRWDQIFYIPVYDKQEKFKFTVNDCNAFFENVTPGFIHV